MSAWMLSLPSLPPVGRCGEPAAWNQYDEFDPADDCREYVEGLDFLVQKWAAQWQPPGVRAPPAPTGRPLPPSGASWFDRSQCHAALELCKAGCTCDSCRGGGGTASSGALTPRSSRIGLMVFLAFFFNKINRCFFQFSGILQLSCASSCSNPDSKMRSVITGAQPLITQPFSLPDHSWVRNGCCAYFK